MIQDALDLVRRQEVLRQAPMHLRQLHLRGRVVEDVVFASAAALSREMADTPSRLGDWYLSYNGRLAKANDSSTVVRARCLACSGWDDLFLL